MSGAGYTRNDGLAPPPGSFQRARAAALLDFWTLLTVCNDCDAEHGGMDDDTRKARDLSREAGVSERKAAAKAALFPPDGGFDPTQLEFALGRYLHSYRS